MVNSDGFQQLVRQLADPLDEHVTDEEDDHSGQKGVQVQVGQGVPPLGQVGGGILGNGQKQRFHRDSIFFLKDLRQYSHILFIIA